MIVAMKVLICGLIFLQTVAAPLVVLFRQPSRQRVNYSFSLLSRSAVQFVLVAMCLGLYFLENSLGFLFVGLTFLLVGISRFVLRDYKANFGDERDFDLASRARSASLLAGSGFLTLYFVAFPAKLDAFSVITGFRLVQYFLEFMFVYLLNLQQNRELETEEA
jgi:hypothetical protein